jgi:hypothetical protein
VKKGPALALDRHGVAVAPSKDAWLHFGKGLLGPFAWPRRADEAKEDSIHDKPEVKRGGNGTR